MEEFRVGYKSNLVAVNNKSNFKSQLTKCQNIIDNIHFTELIIKGMGKATCRASNLAIQLNLNNHNSFELKPRIYSVDILEDKIKKPIKGADKDSFDPDKVDMEDKRLVHVPAIEIIVRKNKIELDKIANIKRQLKQNTRP